MEGDSEKDWERGRKERWKRPKRNKREGSGGNETYTQRGVGKRKGGEEKRVSRRGRMIK